MRFLVEQYWWNHLVSALDMATRIGLTVENPDVRGGLCWLIDHQGENGLSSIHKPAEGAKSDETGLWITLVICNTIKRLYEREGQGL